VHVKLCHKFLIVFFVIPGRYLLHKKESWKTFLFPLLWERTKKVAKWFLGVVEELYFALNMPWGNTRKAGAGRASRPTRDKLWTTDPARFFTRQAMASVSCQVLHQASIILLPRLQKCCFWCRPLYS
jgi:hypothetical protein